jgi:hypothetical protein
MLGLRWGLLRCPIRLFGELLSGCPLRLLFYFLVLFSPVGLDGHPWPALLFCLEAAFYKAAASEVD